MHQVRQLKSDTSEQQNLPYPWYSMILLPDHDLKLPFHRLFYSLTTASSRIYGVLIGKSHLIPLYSQHSL